MVSKIDPAKEKHLQGAKITEFEYNVKRILKLIRDGDLDMDGTPEELLNSKSPAELIEDIYNQYIFYRDHLEGNNLGLRNQISEFEKKSREKEEELSAILKKLGNTENKSSSKISDFTSQINNLEQQMIFRINEASTLVKNITNNVNVLQQEVEYLKHQKSVLEEVLYVETIGENLKLINQIQRMKEEVDRKTLEQERLTREIRKLELEMSTLKSKNMDLQRRLEDEKDAYKKLNEEYIQIDSGFNECKVKLEDATRNMQQMKIVYDEVIGSKHRMVTHLQHKVEYLMKLIKEKEEGIGEEKREAIRQLCLRIDYLREYNDCLCGSSFVLMQLCQLGIVMIRDIIC